MRVQRDSLRHRGKAIGAERYLVGTAEDMVLKCGNCGHENPGHIVYCGQCGENLREPPISSQSYGEGTDSGQSATSEPSISLQRQISRRPTGLSQYSAATIAALAGVMLLALSLAFYVVYYELTMNHLLDPWDSRDSHDSNDMELRNNLAKAYYYSMMIGEICVVLAILLLISGSLMRQRLGMSLACMAQLPLSRMRLLIVLALACVTTSFVIRLFYMEVLVDLDLEWWLRLQGLAFYLYSAAWVFVSIVLFMVARRMQNGVKSSGRFAL